MASLEPHLPSAVCRLQEAPAPYSARGCVKSNPAGPARHVCAVAHNAQEFYNQAPVAGFLPPYNAKQPAAPAQDAGITPARSSECKFMAPVGAVLV